MAWGQVLKPLGFGKGVGTQAFGLLILGALDMFGRPWACSNFMAQALGLWSFQGLGLCSFQGLGPSRFGERRLGSFCPLMVAGLVFYSLGF